MYKCTVKLKLPATGDQYLEGRDREPTIELLNKYLALQMGNLKLEAFIKIDVKTDAWKL